MKIMQTINLEDEITSRLASQKISRAQIKRLYAIAKGDYNLTSSETETVFNWVKAIWKVDHKSDLPAIANDEIEDLFPVYRFGKEKGLTCQEIDAAFQKTKQHTPVFNSSFIKQVIDYFEMFLITF